MWRQRRDTAQPSGVYSDGNCAGAGVFQALCPRMPGSPERWVVVRRAGFGGPLLVLEGWLHHVTWGGESEDTLHRSL